MRKHPQNAPIFCLVSKSRESLSCGEVDMQNGHRQSRPGAVHQDVTAEIA